MEDCPICTTEVRLPTRYDNCCDDKCEEIQDLRDKVSEFEERVTNLIGEYYRNQETIERQDILITSYKHAHKGQQDVIDAEHQCYLRIQEKNHR